MKRFTVTQTFQPHIGDCSLIWDSVTQRRILVAGVDHRKRAERRVELLEAECAERERQGRRAAELQGEA